VGTRAPDDLAYHDEEWGMPEVDDHRLFEKLCLGSCAASAAP